MEKKEGFCGDWNWKREGDVERVARYCIVICNEVTIVKDLVTKCHVTIENKDSLLRDLTYF